MNKNVGLRILGRLAWVKGAKCHGAIRPQQETQLSAKADAIASFFQARYEHWQSEKSFLEAISPHTSFSIL
jgi:hypothetical protein